MTERIFQSFVYVQIAGASLFGILLTKYDPVTCLKLAAGFMIWGLPLSVSNPSLCYLHTAWL